MTTRNIETRDEVLRRLNEDNTTVKALAAEYNLPIQTIYTWTRTYRRRMNKRILQETNSSLKSKIEETILSYNAEINYCERRIRSVRYAMKSILLETKDTDDWDDDWDVTMGLVREYLRDYERLFEQRNDYIRKKSDLEYILKSTNIC